MTSTDDLQARFEQAQRDIKTLAKRPGNADLLTLYSLYKQGSGGDATGSRPGMLDPVGRAKFDAWAKLKGTARDAAMKQYIERVKALLG